MPSSKLCALLLLVLPLACGRDKKNDTGSNPDLPKLTPAGDLQAVSPTSCALHDPQAQLYSCNETRGMSDDAKARQKASCNQPPTATWTDGPCPTTGLAASCAPKVALDGVATTFRYYVAMFSGANGEQTRQAYEKACASMDGVWTPAP